MVNYLCVPSCCLHYWESHYVISSCWLSCCRVQLCFHDEITLLSWGYLYRVVYHTLTFHILLLYGCRFLQVPFTFHIDPNVVVCFITFSLCCQIPFSSSWHLYFHVFVCSVLFAFAIIFIFSLFSSSFCYL